MKKNEKTMLNKKTKRENKPSVQIGSEDEDIDSIGNNSYQSQSDSDQQHTAESNEFSDENSGNIFSKKLKNLKRIRKQNPRKSFEKIFKSSRFHE